jgi:hypothetical protein
MSTGALVVLLLVAWLPAGLLVCALFPKDEQDEPNGDTRQRAA